VVAEAPQAGTRAGFEEILGGEMVDVELLGQALHVLRRGVLHVDPQQHPPFAQAFRHLGRVDLLLDPPVFVVAPHPDHVRTG
jgi:hypothetical protein